MRLAPVGVSTYVRLDHLQRTLEALQLNHLASETEVFVFSDGPRPGHEDRVAAVRAYAKTVAGFKNLTVLERPVNSRIENNRGGLRMLLETYGRAIFLEEDIVTAPIFLDFMNQALEVYERNPRIFSVAGYSPGISIPAGYPYDVFVFQRFDPWGFGIWKDRLDMVEMKIPGRVMRRIFLNPLNIYRFSRGGLDVLPMAFNQYFEFGNGLDVRLFTQEFALGMLTVFPVPHLVNNIGLDGSGYHPKIKPWWNPDLSTERSAGFRMPEAIEPHPAIVSAMYNFRSGNYWNRLRQIGWLFLTFFRRAFIPTSIWPPKP